MRDAKCLGSSVQGGGRNQTWCPGLGGWQVLLLGWEDRNLSGSQRGSDELSSGQAKFKRFTRPPKAAFREVDGGVG